jgi:hypothetical protein
VARDYLVNHPRATAAELSRHVEDSEEISWFFKNEDCKICAQTNADCVELNWFFAERRGLFVWVEGGDIDEPNRYLLAINAPVRLRANLNPSAGVTNGANGHLRHVAYDAGGKPQVWIVELETYRGEQMIIDSELLKLQAVPGFVCKNVLNLIILYSISSGLRSGAGPPLEMAICQSPDP